MSVDDNECKLIKVTDQNMKYLLVFNGEKINIPPVGTTIQVCPSKKNC